MRNWKGNIRELSHCIEQAVIMSEAETLDFSSILTSRKEIAKPAASTAGLMSMTDFEEEIKVMERKFILEALDRSGGRVSGEGGAAQLLSIHPNTLYSRIETLGIRKRYKNLQGREPETSSR